MRLGFPDERQLQLRSRSKGLVVVAIQKLRLGIYLCIQMQGHTEEGPETLRKLVGMCCFELLQTRQLLDTLEVNRNHHVHTSI